MRLTLPRLACPVLPAFLLALTLAGCATDSDSVGTISFMGEGTSVPGAPVDVYLRVARGAKSCWFAEGQPLADGYVFAADVQPEDKGGAAQITIFEAAPENKRGLKAFSVAIVKPAAGGAGRSVVGPENARLAEPLGARMKDDALRWAAGEAGCVAAEGVWQPQPEAPPEPAKPKGKGKKVKA